MDVDQKQRLLEPRRLGHDLAERIDDVGTAPERESILDPNAIHEYDIALQHARVEAGRLPPVRLGLRHGPRARRRDEQELRAVLHGERGQERLPRVVADQDGGAPERGVERAHRLAGSEVSALLERRVIDEAQLAVDVERGAVLDVGRAVVAPPAVPLVKADERGDAVRDRGRGDGGGAGSVVLYGAEGVAAELELRKDDEVGAPGPRLRHRLLGSPLVRVEIAESRVELGEGDPHAVQPTPRHSARRGYGCAVRAIAIRGDELRLEELPDPVPGSSEVVVAAAFAGINPADLAQRAGRYPAPPGAPQDVPGLEVAGRVVARGGQVRDWQVGDRVFGLVGGGGLADRVVVHERHVVAVPERLDEQEAAAVPEAFVTAHDALVGQAGLGAGDVLLVNGASGGVGTAAVQLGVLGGARVFANVRSQEAALRLAEYGAEVVGPSDAVERVQAAGGADVVLELVGAPNLAGDLEALAMRGRVVIVGTGAGDEAQLSLHALMRRRARIYGTVLRARPLEEKAAAVQAFGHDVLPFLADGRARGIVDRVFPAEQAVEAFDYMAQPGKFGKVLLSL
jgi:NADPH:quinone reductase